MMIAIGDSLSDLASSDDDNAGDVEVNEDTELGNLREDDEHGWVMGTISKMVQQHTEWFRQKQMKFNTMTQLGLGDAADYFCESEKEYSSTELRVPAVIQLERVDSAATAALTRFGEVLISSPEYHKCRKGLLNQAVVQ